MTKRQVAIFIAPKIIGGDAAHAALGGKGARTMADSRSLEFAISRPLGADTVIEGLIRSRL